MRPLMHVSSSVQLHGRCHITQCTASWLRHRGAMRTHQLSTTRSHAPEPVMDPTDGADKAKGLKKRPVALHVGYVGTEYRGLQASSADDMEMRLKTVEGLLERAILQAGFMLASNYGHMHKVKWKHASRTDKGVHSLYTVVTFNMLLDEAVMQADSEGIHYSQLINLHLPQDIRVFSVQRVSPSFDPRRYCQQRRYTYFLPASVLGIQDGSCQEDVEKLGVFCKALEEYRGTKPFHNYAGRRRQYRKDDKRNSGRGGPMGSREKTEQAMGAVDATVLSEDDADGADDDDDSYARQATQAGTGVKRKGDRSPQEISHSSQVMSHSTQEISNNTQGTSNHLEGISIIAGSNGVTGRETRVVEGISARGTNTMHDKDRRSESEETPDHTWSGKKGIHPLAWLLPVVFGGVTWFVGGPFVALGLMGCAGVLGLVGHKLGFWGHVQGLLYGPMRWMSGLLGRKVQEAGGEAGRQLQGNMDPWLMSVKFNETVDESDRVVRSHFRTIRDIRCSEVMQLTPGGVPCVKVDIVGTSFMLHQIRHMVGAAAAVTVGVLPWELFQLSLTVPTRVSLPRAPPHTLMLDGAAFGDFYKAGSDKNQQLLTTTGERLELREQGTQQRDTFNTQVLYPAMNNLLHDPVWAAWSGILSRHMYNPAETEQALALYKQWHKPVSGTTDLSASTSPPGHPPQLHTSLRDTVETSLSRMVSEGGVSSLGITKTSAVQPAADVLQSQDGAAVEQKGRAGGPIPLRRPPAPTVPDDSHNRKPKPKMRVPPEVELYCRADMLVARIESVQEVEGSEKLLACRVDCGRGEVRQAVSALKHLVKLEELQGQQVVAISNVRPAKLAGQLSNCVVLVGWRYRADGSKEVRLVHPPDGSEIGDSVYLSGHRKQCQAIAPAYRVNPSTWDRFQNQVGSREDGVVTFNRLALVTGTGERVAFNPGVTGSDVDVGTQGREPTGGASAAWVVEGA